MSAARSAVRSVVGIRWYSADYGLGQPKETNTFNPKSLEWRLSNLTCIDKRSGDKPILLFIESRENISRGAREKATKQYLNSFKVSQKVFYDDKHKGRIAGSMFKCLRMDVTTIKKSKDDLICSKAAPMIALYSKEGILQKVFKGSSTTCGSVYATMCKLMKPQGVNIDKIYRATYKDLDRLYKNEIKLYGYYKELSKAKEKFKKLRNKSAAAQKKVDRAQKKYDDCMKISTEIKSRCKKLLEAEPAA